MKNIALIFAGGVGRRMNTTAKPKQFLELHGKPIIIHTIEKFDQHQSIDGIVIVIVDGWQTYLQTLLMKHNIKKVISVVTGGDSGQASIFKGLKEIDKKISDNPIVLIHDGVRPLINDDLINKNIESVKQKGNAITTTKTIETFVIEDDDKIIDIPNRANSLLAKAPQSFYLDDILNLHQKAIEDNYTGAIDSCTLFHHYGKTLHTVNGPFENIKITTPLDFYIFRAIYDAKENK